MLNYMEEERYKVTVSNTSFHLRAGRCQKFSMGGFVVWEGGPRHDLVI